MSRPPSFKVRPLGGRRHKGHQRSLGQLLLENRDLNPGLVEETFEEQYVRARQYVEKQQDDDAALGGGGQAAGLRVSGIEMALLVVGGVCMAGGRGAG